MKIANLPIALQNIIEEHCHSRLNEIKDCSFAIKGEKAIELDNNNLIYSIITGNTFNSDFFTDHSLVLTGQSTLDSNIFNYSSSGMKLIKFTASASLDLTFEQTTIITVSQWNSMTLL